MEWIYEISILAIFILAVKFLPKNEHGNSYEGSVNASELKITDQSEINKSWLQSLQEQISGSIGPNTPKDGNL